MDQTHPEFSAEEMPIAPRVVVIGASTGGPSALAQILKQLPEKIPIPIFVAQHMPEEFLPDFVKGLRKEACDNIHLATQNQRIEAGHIYISPSDRDALVIIDPLGDYHVILVDAYSDLRPSIDRLMASVATVYGAGCLGIILTGMGTDGLEGMRAIKAMGGRTVVQDKATSAVYGMAHAVESEQLADAVLPLSEIANRIIEWGSRYV